MDGSLPFLFPARGTGLGSCGFIGGCGHGLDHIHLGDRPLEEIVGALALQLADLRQVGRVGQDGVDELVERPVGGVYLAGQAVVEGPLLPVVEPRGQDALHDQRVVGEDVAHVVGVGVELLDDRRHDDHVDRVIDPLHLDELRVDGVFRFEVPGHAVGEDHEFGVGQVIEVGHLTVAFERFAHGLALFVVPFALLRAASEPDGKQPQQGQAE